MNLQIRNVPEGLQRRCKKLAIDAGLSLQAWAVRALTEKAEKQEAEVEADEKLTAE